MLPQVSIIASFLAGSLALLPSCGPLLLPAFFAYSLSTREKLLRSAVVFVFGFGLVFVPFGLGVKWLADALIVEKVLLEKILGSLVFVFGFLSFFAISLPASLRKGARFTSPLLLGLGFGFTAGACSAPILGAVLTLSLLQPGNPLVFLHLLSFLLGMLLPLLVLAFLLRSVGSSKISQIFGKGFTISIFGKELRVFWTNFISGLLFMILGLALFTGSDFWRIFGVADFSSLYHQVNLWLMR